MVEHQFVALVIRVRFPVVAQELQKQIKLHQVSSAKSWLYFGWDFLQLPRKYKNGLNRSRNHNQKAINCQNKLKSFAIVQKR